MLDLEIWGSHGYHRLALVAAGDDTSVIIGKDHYRTALQFRLEGPFA